MSRSALWHQEKNVQRRQQEAEEAWEQVVEEGRNNRARNLVPLWGPDDSFHFEPLLLNNIKRSAYFIKIAQEIKDWTGLVDEIYYKVDHIEPWAIGGVHTPSTGFCLLLRVLAMRCTANQMTLMLNHQDSPYIRAIGFLYLRYSCDPAQLFGWMEPYLYDDEPIQVSASKKAAGGRGPRSSSGRDGGMDYTIGSFVRSLLSSTSRDYYGTMLPRLPIQIERDIQVKLLQAEKVQKRAESHFRNKRTMDYFQKLGSKVMATYEDEENPLQWYEAEVDRVILRGEDASLLKYPKFVVTFTEYGNTETVMLGQMDLPDGSFCKEDRGKGNTTDKGYGDRGRFIQRTTDRDDLYDEVRRRERETVTASGRDYFSRPPTTKRSLAAPGGRRPPLDRRRHSPSPSAGARSHSPPPPRKADRKINNDDDRERDSRAQQSPPRKRSADELAAIEEKKRKLRAKYG